jgi:hypothetical protein
VAGHPARPFRWRISSFLPAEIHGLEFAHDDAHFDELAKLDA